MKFWRSNGGYNLLNFRQASSKMLLKAHLFLVALLLFLANRGVSGQPFDGKPTVISLVFSPMFCHWPPSGL